MEDTSKEGSDTIEDQSEKPVEQDPGPTLDGSTPNVITEGKAKQVTTGGKESPTQDENVANKEPSTQEEGTQSRANEGAPTQEEETQGGANEESPTQEEETQGGANEESPTQEEETQGRANEESPTREEGTQSRAKEDTPTQEEGTQSGGGTVTEDAPTQKERAQDGANEDTSTQEERTQSGSAEESSPSEEATTDENKEGEKVEEIERESAPGDQNAEAGGEAQTEPRPLEQSGEVKEPATKDKVAGAQEQDEEEVEPEPVFDYSYNSMKSRPEVINVPTDDMLELVHSFGYECQKRSNLVVLSKETVAYSAGNLVILVDLATQNQSFFRSLGGGGIGALAVHPSQAYLAVGEKGTQPVIAIYTVPELKLYRVLRGGTEEMYSHLDFSPNDGKLLASVGGNPDYMLTVWDWKREHIVLRSKAFSQDIYRVTFSPENPGQLTTSGTGHIRFWKMATTFTGLKLQGYLGKFGRVEISDISAYVELPDGKVLSGTEWGNLLLWDGGFIKVEISRKGKKFCHNGMIEAIYLDEGELISAGADGYVRVWDFETIDNADITDDNTVFEMDPLVEIKVGSDVSIKSLARSVDPDTPTLWFGQDACGAIWKIDTIVSHTRKAPEKLVSFHSGKITGLACSPVTHQAATIAENGSVRVYDLLSNEVLCHTQLPSGGSSLIWAPPSIDPTTTTLITGHQDGVLRVLRLEEKTGHLSGRHRGQRYQLNLVHACKPHTQAVSCLAIDPEGEIVVSGGKNCTVFFLNPSENYEPIGFVSTPSPVATLQWSSGEQANHPLCLLVCCEDGSMLEVEAPKKGEYDTSKSYYLDPLKFKARKFTSIKDRLRAEEEEARLAAEREAKQKEKEAHKAKRRELLGDDYVSEDEDEESEGGDGGEEGEGAEGQPPAEQEEKVKEPGTILKSFYSQGDEKNFWVSMSGHDAGYLYQCSLDGATSQEPEPYEAPHTLPVPPVAGDDLPLHSLTFNSTGEYLLTGTSNGVVRIHPLSTPYSLSSLDSYWALSMHDNHYGPVSHLAVSFDDQYLISGGGDGNVFVYRTHLPALEQQEVEAKEVKIPTESGQSANDIEDPEHYSIEDAKQKAEHDRKIKLAEEKKQTVRRQIASLRRAFTKLRQKDNDLPKQLRLDSREFVMDPDMEEQLKQQTEEKIGLVKKEVAWESEKITVGLKKLQNKYKDVVACELITVWTFTEQERVSSFRFANPSDVFLKLLNKFLEEDSVAPTPWTAVEGTEKRKNRGLVGGERRGNERTQQEGAEEEEDGEKKISKQEARRLKKEMRKKEWEELYQSKPDMKFDDPNEAAALKLAKENMGDYKLKTASDYVVPDHQRVTTESKRKQHILVKKQIFDEKQKYNDKLIRLRDMKLKIIDKISSLVSSMADIQSNLPKSLHKPLPSVPTIKPEEVPERRLQYTKESLLQFKEQLKAKEEAERQAAATGGDGGFFGGFGGGDGGDGGGEGEAREGVEEGKKEDKEDSESETSHPGSTSETEKEPLTPLQAVLKKENQIRSVYQRDCLLSEVEQLKKDFNEALLRLRHEKAELDITMVTADLKHITQFEELQLLKEFAKKETTFTTRYRTKKRERQDMETQIEEAQWRVSEAEEKLACLIDQEKALEQSFVQSIGENNKFKEFLLKVFRKKIKRAKKKVEEDKKEGEHEEEDESDEESDSDYISSSDDESEAEGELDDSICPAGCDQALYDQATQLREKRLDLDDAITEDKKAFDAMRKELEAKKKKIKSMETHVKSALSDLQAFQLRKQQRLNELDQVAVLALHQILHYKGYGEPPTSIAPCLVFPSSALYSLGKRIGELTVEKQEEKKRYKELRQRHVKLVREKKEMLAKIAKLDEKANEAMMLKFGRVVDLDRLEGLSVNHIVEELRSKLRTLEQRAGRDLAVLATKIDTEKRRLAQVTRENTKRLDKEYELHTAKQSLEDRLNSRQKSMSKDVAGGDGGADAQEERERLLHLVRIQVQEIEALRQEIRILQLKGGRIIPPSQPPTQAQVV